MHKSMIRVSLTQRLLCWKTDMRDVRWSFRSPDNTPSLPPPASPPPQSLLNIMPHLLSSTHNWIQRFIVFIRMYLHLLWSCHLGPFIVSYLGVSLICSSLVWVLKCSCMFLGIFTVLKVVKFLCVCLVLVLCLFLYYQILHN